MLKVKTGHFKRSEEGTAECCWGESAGMQWSLGTQEEKKCLEKRWAGFEGNDFSVRKTSLQRDGVKVTNTAYYIIIVYVINTVNVHYGKIPKHHFLLAARPLLVHSPCCINLPSVTAVILLTSLYLHLMWWSVLMWPDVIAAINTQPCHITEKSLHMSLWTSCYYGNAKVLVRVH